MFIATKSLPRRTVLKGIGATLALPVLESMTPTLRAARAAAPVSRCAFVYVPHGVILDQFTPVTEGADFEFRPIMKPLEAFRSRLTW